MIKHLKRSDIDTTRWNDSIKKSINGSIYAMSWYLDHSCASWEAIVMENYEAVLPLPIFMKFGIPMIITPLTVQQLDIYSSTQLSEAQSLEMINAIPKRLKRIHIASQNQIFSALPFGDKPKNRKQKINLILPLNKNYEVLKSAYSNSHLKGIKRAQKENFVLQYSTKARECVDFFKSNVGASISLPNSYFVQTEKIINAALKHKSGQILQVVSPTHGIMAMSFVGSYKNRIYDLLSSSSPLGKKKRAMFFLIDQIIQEYSNRDMILDFEGSSIAGIANFYKGFGATEVPYYIFDRWRGDLLARFTRMLYQIKQ